MCGWQIWKIEKNVMKAVEGSVFDFVNKLKNYVEIAKQSIHLVLKNYNIQSLNDTLHAVS